MANTLEELRKEKITKNPFYHPIYPLIEQIEKKDGKYTTIKTYAKYRILVDGTYRIYQANWEACLTDEYIADKNKNGEDIMSATKLKHINGVIKVCQIVYMLSQKYSQDFNNLELDTDQTPELELCEESVRWGLADGFM